MTKTFVNLAVEDDLSEAVLKKIIATFSANLEVNICLKKRGFGYLKSKINQFNQSAKSAPFIVLTDLDQAPCPSALVSSWLKQPQDPNLLLRVAVREVEAWLLADREGMANLLGISSALVDLEVESILNPKEYLIKLARKSKKREIREGIVPAKNTTARIGKNYNSILISFVANNWRIEIAQDYSPSLTRAINAIKALSLRCLDFHHYAPRRDI